MKRNIWKQFMAVAALAGIAMLSSCMKNDNDFKPDPQGGLFVLHAAPEAGSLDIYLNGEKASNYAFSFTDNSTASLTPNDYRIAFVKPVSGDTVAAAQDSIKDQHTYSAIFYNFDSTSRDSVKLMLFEDLYDTGASGASTFIRFLQLSPDVKGGVSIYIDKDIWASGRTFVDNQGDPLLAKFRPLSVGQYNITALDAHGDTIDQKSANLQLNNYNTIYLSGVKDSTVADSLQLQLRVTRSY